MSATWNSRAPHKCIPCRVYMWRSKHTGTCEFRHRCQISRESGRCKGGEPYWRRVGSSSASLVVCTQGAAAQWLTSRAWVPNVPCTPATTYELGRHAQALVLNSCSNATRNGSNSCANSRHAPILRLWIGSRTCRALNVRTAEGLSPRRANSLAARKKKGGPEGPPL